MNSTSQNSGPLRSASSNDQPPTVYSEYDLMNTVQISESFDFVVRVLDRNAPPKSFLVNLENLKRASHELKFDICKYTRGLSQIVLGKTIGGWYGMHGSPEAIERVLHVLHHFERAKRQNSIEFDTLIGVVELCQRYDLFRARRMSESLEAWVDSLFYRPGDKSLIIDTSVGRERWLFISRQLEDLGLAGDAVGPVLKALKVETAAPRPRRVDESNRRAVFRRLERESSQAIVLDETEDQARYRRENNYTTIDLNGVPLHYLIEIEDGRLALVRALEAELIDFATFFGLRGEKNCIEECKFLECRLIACGTISASIKKLGLAPYATRKVCWKWYGAAWVLAYKMLAIKMETIRPSRMDYKNVDSNGISKMSCVVVNRPSSHEDKLDRITAAYERACPLEVRYLAMREKVNKIMDSIAGAPSSRAESNPRV